MLGRTLAWSLVWLTLMVATLDLIDRHAEEPPLVTAVDEPDQAR